jgi:isocitrate lyase
MTPAPLKTISPPISTALPSDAFQLLQERDKAGQAEDALFEQQLKDVETWWATPRYKGIKRPYSAADVVSKRGSQMQSYPSSVMARKLFNLLAEKEAKGEPIYTSARRPAFRFHSLC